MKTQINKSELMTTAHQIAKTLEGDYSARMSYAMKQAWSELTKEEEGEEADFVLEYGQKCISPATYKQVDYLYSFDNVISRSGSFPSRSGMQKYCDREACSEAISAAKEGLTVMIDF